MNIAAFCNSPEAFIFLHSKRLPINGVIEESNCPISYACYSGSYEIVEYILSVDPKQASAKFRINDRFFIRESPSLIYLAMRSGNPDILRLLIKNGAKDEFSEKNIFYAIETNNIECFKVLQTLYSSKNQLGYSLLMLAIVGNEQDHVPFLVECGENPEYSTPETHDTALSLACFQGFRQTVKYLCEHMSNVDIDPTLRTKAAVHWICQSKDPEIARMVLNKGIDVNRLDKDGHTGAYYLLDFTDEQTAIKIIELLFEHGFDLNIRGKSVTGTEVNTILGDFVSSIHRPEKIVGWLLQHGADPEAKLVTNNKRIIDFIQTPINRKLLEVFKKWVPADKFKQTGRGRLNRK